LESLPRIFFALIFAIAISYIVANFSDSEHRGLLSFLSYLLFIPPYGVPFLLFAVLLISGARFDAGTAVSRIVCTLSTAIPSTALLASQTHAIMRKNLMSQHAVSLLSFGVSKHRVRFLLYRNLIYEITPTFEKVITGVMTGLMFSEMVFGLSGIGALAIRAIRRSDIELLLGVVVVFATLICIARLLSTIVLSFYRTVS
jgi:ABC-type dipeptide/oligopeptide/nickel transport system permease component